MKLSQFIDEDLVNYKTASLFIGTTKCTGKCWRELGLPCDTCQNSSLYDTKNIIDMSNADICTRYIENPITNAIVIGGLEPFDTREELYEFIRTLREEYHNDDMIVIYSGYYPDELLSDIEFLSSQYKNIIIKFGRFIPNKDSRYDDILGVTLISDNQFARQIC